MQAIIVGGMRGVVENGHSDGGGDAGKYEANRKYGSYHSKSASQGAGKIKGSAQTNRAGRSVASPRTTQTMLRNAHSTHIQRTHYCHIASIQLLQLNPFNYYIRVALKLGYQLKPP